MAVCLTGNHPCNTTLLMSGQASFEGFDPPARPRDRLFFAFMPDHEAALRTQTTADHLRGAHQLKGKPLGVDRFHVSLFHVGDYAGLPEPVVAQASRVADGITAAPFEMAFDRAVTFSGKPGHLPFVLLGREPAPLMAFHAALERQMRQAGLGQGGLQRRFTPHMTLLYGDHPVAEQGVAPIAWTAREFVLVHSLIGQGRYIVLARWPLRAPMMGDIHPQLNRR